LFFDNLKEKEMKKLALLMVAVLFVAFVSAQTKTELKPADLSKPAAEYIAKNFVGYTVDKVFKCDNKGTVTTEVMVAKGPEKQTLVFDKEGKFLKKEAAKVESKTTVKPPVKTTPPVKEEPKKK
jgi:hypothetical protein